MSRNAHIIFFATLNLFIGLTALCPRSIDAGGNSPSIRFRWSFCAQTGLEDRSEIVAITKDTPLRSGDRIKMFLQPVSTCYLYVLYYSSQGELSLLYPTNLSTREVPDANQILIPEGNHWLRLDGHTGPETFYLIASVKRLDHLEELIDRHLKPTGREDTTISAEAIINELKNLRRQHLKLAAPAERPVRLGGNLRDAAGQQFVQDIRRFAIEISAQDFFSRTFTIDHQ